MDRLSRKRGSHILIRAIGAFMKTNCTVLKKGDVIYAERNLYRHYGIYTGRETVVHYLKCGGFPVAIEETSLDDFSRGNSIHIRQFPSKTTFSPRETVWRAKSQIGQTGYNILFNNCEHFALWCKTGRYESSQAQDIWKFFFGARREPAEVADELATKILGGIYDFFDGIADKIDDLYEKLPQF
jgi:hypothetical protein